MLPLLTTVSLPQVYCGWCHLSTRSDMARCLHCNKLLQAPPAAAGRAHAGKHAPARATGKAARRRSA